MDVDSQPFTQAQVPNTSDPPQREVKADNRANAG